MTVRVTQVCSRPARASARALGCLDAVAGLGSNPPRTNNRRGLKPLWVPPLAPSVIPVAYERRMRCYIR